jgi:hypothetical protein
MTSFYKRTLLQSDARLSNSYARRVCGRGGAGRVTAPFAALRGSATGEDVPFGDDIRVGRVPVRGEAGRGVV